MKEVISLENLKINEDGSFSTPTNSRLEKGLEHYRSASTNNRCVNQSCNGSDNIHCDNQKSCSDSFNINKCKSTVEVPIYIPN